MDDLDLERENIINMINNSAKYKKEVEGPVIKPYKKRYRLFKNVN